VEHSEVYSCKKIKSAEPEMQYIEKIG